MLYPSGVNLADNTAMTLLGLVSAPVTVLLGPIAAYNLLLRAGFALSGLAMFLTTRRIVRWQPAAFGAGLLYGFSPFMVGQGKSHAFLVFAALPPLILGIVYFAVTGIGSRSPRRAGLLLGVLAAAQFFVSPEVLLMTGVVAAIGIALALAGRQQRRVTAMARLGRTTAWALLPFGAAAAYPLWFFFAGPQHVIGSPHPLSDLSAFHGDLLGALIPAPTMRLGTSGLFTLGAKLVSRNVLENGTYLGLPLVVALGVLAIRYRRVPPVALVALVALASYAVSLGSRISVANHSTAIPGPFAALAHLPVLQDIEPVRFSLLTALLVAVLLAVCLDQLRFELLGRRVARAASGTGGAPGSSGLRSRRATSAVVGLLGIVVLVPLLPRWPYPAASSLTPTFFTSRAIDRVLPGSVAVTFPFPELNYNQALVWQSVAQMRFRLLGGTTFFVRGTDGRAVEDYYPPLALSPPGIDSLFEDVLLGASAFGRRFPPLDAATLSAIFGDLGRYDVRSVFIDPGLGRVTIAVRYLTEAIGRPPQLIGGVLAWFDLRPEITGRRPLVS